MGNYYVVRRFRWFEQPAVELNEGPDFDWETTEPEFRRFGHNEDSVETMMAMFQDDQLQQRWQIGMASVVAAWMRKAADFGEFDVIWGYHRKTVEVDEQAAQELRALADCIEDASVR